ncbi:hypothetical protein ACP4OV_030962 [Aristida adscensionis]
MRMRCSSPSRPHRSSTHGTLARPGGRRLATEARRRPAVPRSYATCSPTPRDTTMNSSAAAKRFGGGRPPTGTPSLAWSSVVIVASLLAGASIVHNIYKPDMTIPPVDVESTSSGDTQHT